MSESNFLKKFFDYKQVANNLELGICPQIIGYEMCSKKKAPITYYKSWFTLHFVISGYGFLSEENGFSSRIGPNTCFLLEPGSKATYGPDPDDPWTYAWVEFSGTTAKKLCQKADFNHFHNILSCDRFEEIISFFKEIFSDYDSSTNEDSRDIFYASVLMNIFSILIGEHEEEATRESMSDKEANVAKIIQYFKANYTNPNLSVNDAAKKLFFSPAYLTRLFKEVTGVAPSQYIIDLRMREACDLLTKHSLSILKIASAVGYKNQFYFSKEFKRYYSVPPSRYTKKENNQSE